jgi:subfamily B ATP-binding cassette protein MsbA
LRTLANVRLVEFLKTVLRLARPYRGRLVMGILCGFIAGLSNPLLMGSVKLVFEVAFPEPGAPSLGERAAGWLEQAEKGSRLPRVLVPLADSIRPVLERLGQSHSAWLPVLAIATIPFAMLLRGLFGYLNIYLMNWVSVRAVTDLRTRLFTHLMSLSAGFFSKISTGELMSRLNEVNTLQQVMSQAMVVMIKEPVTLIGLIVFLLYQQPTLTFVALFIFPVTLIPFVVYARKVRKSSDEIYQKYAEMGRMMHESFTGFRIVKAYNLEKKVVDDFDATSRAAVSHAMRILRSMEIPGPLMEFFGAVAVACFFIYIALFAQTTPGGLVAFVGSVFLTYQPIKSLIRLSNQLQTADSATRYAFGLLATQSTIQDPPQPVPLVAERADIEFRHVHFSYGDKAAVAGIDLAVKAGQMVALVGGSGSGKTTLTNLLLRFYDPQQGGIYIGGVDIRKVGLADLRRQIAIVTQETILFNDTIANNIGFGRPGASIKEIVAAAKHAYAHDFIMEKPGGYDTVIGERGVMLSGGQRQRLAIARAILKDGPILILDEATSSLDSESERAIQAALDELMQHRTTICIAHRLSTIQGADRIVVLQDGRIVETGRHEELLASGGIYRKLYELQFEEQ